MEKFTIGVMLGALGGALLVANNYKMRALVKKGQEEALNKLDELLEKKIQEMGEGAEKIKEKAEETVDNVKKKAGA